MREIDLKMAALNKKFGADITYIGTIVVILLENYLNNY